MVRFAMNSISPRYSRNLGTLGIEGQNKLLMSRVMIVGLGGLGGYVAEISARLGIGTIIGIDHDFFDETNLNRQSFSDEKSTGEPKAIVAREKIKRINSNINFVAVEKPVEEVENTIFAQTHLIFDCLDNDLSRIHLQSRASEHNITLIHGAVAGWYGQVAVVLPGSDILDHIYKSSSSGIEKERGTPSFTPPVAAGIMVCEAVKVLLDTYEKENILIFFDLLNHECERFIF